MGSETSSSFSGTCHNRAVASPELFYREEEKRKLNLHLAKNNNTSVYPDAKREETTGFQAHENTSL